MESPEVDHPGAVGVAMYASRRFHSSGTIQSKHPRAARDLGPGDRDLLLEHVEGGPHAVAGQAAAERDTAAASARSASRADGVRLPARAGASALVTPARPCGRRTPRRRSSASCTPCRAAAAGSRRGPRGTSASSAGSRSGSSGGRSCAREVARSSGTKAFGALMSPSYFGTSYSRIRWSRKVFQVSSQLRPVILVQVGTLVGEDHVGREVGLQLLEEVLDALALVGKEAVGKVARPRPRCAAPRRGAPRRSGAPRRRARPRRSGPPSRSPRQPPARSA